MKTYQIHRYFAPSIAYIMEKNKKLELTLKQAYKVKSN